MCARFIRWSMTVAGGLVLSSATMAAQAAPPIGGATGTVATEGSMKAFYRGARTIIVTTADGIDHVFEFTKDLIVHGGKRPGPDALSGLREGTTVVVHYTPGGTQPSAQEVDVVGDQVKVTEGMVTKLDRRHHELTVRYDNGKTETFRLSDRASGETANDAAANAAEGAKVQIFYVDEQGKKVAHFFKRVS